MILNEHYNYLNNQTFYLTTYTGNKRNNDDIILPIFML